MPFWLQTLEKNLIPPWNHCGSAMNNHQRELHVCTQTYGKLLGGILKMFFFWVQISQNMVSDKTIHKAFIIQKLYKWNPLEIFFLFLPFTKAIHWL